LAAALKHFTSAGGTHALAETMFPAALPFLGLIRSFFHAVTSISSKKLHKPNHYTHLGFFSQINFEN
jgi:hypothetical protein